LINKIVQNLKQGSILRIILHFMSTLDLKKSLILEIIIINSGFNHFILIYDNLEIWKISIMLSVRVSYFKFLGWLFEGH